MRWNSLTIALHWLAGVLILELIAHGWIMVQASARLVRLGVASVDASSPEKSFAASIG